MTQMNSVYYSTILYLYTICGWMNLNILKNVPLTAVEKLSPSSTITTRIKYPIFKIILSTTTVYCSWWMDDFSSYFRPSVNTFRSQSMKLKCESVGVIFQKWNTTIACYGNEHFKYTRSDQPLVYWLYVITPNNSQIRAQCKCHEQYWALIYSVLAVIYTVRTMGSWVTPPVEC